MKQDKPSEEPARALAEDVSSRVKTIIEAAEETAEKIVGDAKRESAEVREEATRAAEATRSDALANAREQIENLKQAAEDLASRAATLSSGMVPPRESGNTGFGPLAEPDERSNEASGERAGTPEEGLLRRLHVGRKTEEGETELGAKRGV